MIVLSPWTVGAFPGRAMADVQAILACRQLPPGPGRADCFEKASADLDQHPAASAQGSRPAAGLPVPPANGAAHQSRLGRPGRVVAKVETITYRDGKPIFSLENGQVWYSLDRRHLTFKPGRSYATIVKTPVGMLLHYNGSFFALQVVPAQG
jgi:hypothetical protein